MKNKEDYKRRKEKDRIKKLNLMLEKHKNLLRKEIVQKQTIMKESQVDIVRVCFSLCLSLSVRKDDLQMILFYCINILCFRMKYLLKQENLLNM